MKLYLQIGFPRSATTYIQKNYFSKNKEIHHIARKLNYGIQDENFFDFLNKIIRYSDKEFNENKKSLLVQFKKIKFSKNKINLISEEGILCERYWNNNDVYRTLNRIIIILNKLKIDHRYIIIIRNQLDCLQSVYRYFFSGYFKKNFRNLNNFLNIKNSKSRKILSSFNYYKLFKFLKKKNKKVIFLLFEDLIKNENIIVNKLYKFLRLKKKLSINSKNINSNKNIFYKYSSFYNNFFYKFFYLFDYKKYSKLFFLFSRLKDDFFVLYFLKFSKNQKKKIFKIFLAENYKLSKSIKLNQKYLKFDIS